MSRLPKLLILKVPPPPPRSLAIRDFLFDLLKVPPGELPQGQSLPSSLLLP